MCARANSWAMVAAVSGKRPGSIRVGAAGQMMRTMAGMPSGSTSSMMIVPDALMVVSARRGNVRHWDSSSFVAWDSGPVRCSQQRPGTYLCVGAC